MRKCRLIAFTTSSHLRRGEPYITAKLVFEVVLFGFIKYHKSIRYDVTMFENFEEHKCNWSSMIENKYLVKYSIIKDRIIFK